MYKNVCIQNTWNLAQNTGDDYNYNYNDKDVSVRVGKKLKKIEILHSVDFKIFFFLNSEIN